MRKALLALVSVIAFGSIVTLATAENTIAPPYKKQYDRAGGSMFATAADFNSASESCFLDSGGSSLLIPWDSLATVSCTEQAVFCWTLAPPGDFTINMATLALTDSNGADGFGNCFRVEAGTYVDNSNLRNNLSGSSAILRRSGVCTVGGAANGRPCGTAGDCPTGGAACTAGVFSQITGAYLCGRRNATDLNCALRFDG